MNTTKKSLIALTALAFMFVGCGNIKKEDVKKAQTMEEIQRERGKPVRTVKAAKVSIDDIRTFNGTIEGVNPATVIAKRSDPLKNIKVKVGSSVKKDQVLAEYEDTGDNITMQQLAETIKLQEDVVRRMREVYEKGGLSQQDLEAQEMQLRIYKMQQEQARRANVVLAPADGIVTEVFLEEGQVPNVGSPLFSTAKLNNVILTLASVGAKDIGLFKQGMKAEVEINGKVVSGKVSRIPLAANPQTRFFPVEITFNNSKRDLLPGMFVATKLRAATVNAVAVPTEAVIYNNGNNFVWTNVDGKAKRNLVRTGVANSEYTQIIEGINEDDVIIYVGMSKLNDNDKVLEVE